MKLDLRGKIRNINLYYGVSCELHRRCGDTARVNGDR